MQTFTDSWDSDWMGSEVVIHLSDGDHLRGKLKDYGTYYATVIIGTRETTVNTAHIVSITVVQ